MEEGVPTTEASDINTSNEVLLEVEVATGIKHAFETLDEGHTGVVAKSQLQAIVANVCRAVKTPYVSENLENYMTDKEKLSFDEFLAFLQTNLLVKGKKLDEKEMDELSWVVVGQKYEDKTHIVSKKDAYKLWLAFKKLDITGELKVAVEEICIFLEKFIRGMGVQWNEHVLETYDDDGTMTFWTFIDCLDEFLPGVDKNVLKEGLQDLYATILDEVMLTGFLSKKGHNVLKSQKSRWFVLNPDHLTYYVSSGYREKKGEIILNSEAKVVSIPDKGSNKCRFMVTCGKTKRDYEQTAPDQRTRQAWIKAIQSAIDCHGGETPLKRDLAARKAKRDEDKRRKEEEERRRQEQDSLLDQQREEIDLLKKRKAEIERFADAEKEALDAEIKRREELEELQRNLQQLLEDQKSAREEEEKVRAAKERLLEEEQKKREELEALRLQQQQELQEEKMQKEELIERQKEQERVLEEERKRLRHLEGERMKAEEAAKAAQDKLSAAESAAKSAAEQAKDRVRQLKTSIGLKGTIAPRADPLVSHRGKGAFTLEEFLNRATDWSGLPMDEEDKYRPAPLTQHATHDKDELVKASATPTPNQNIPEFLRKAAAWSGLNPETYLEEAKSGGPPKVAAKPQRPPSQNVVDGQVMSAPDKGPEGVSGDVKESEGVQNDQNDQVESVKDSEVKDEVKIESPKEDETEAVVPPVESVTKEEAPKEDEGSEGISQSSKEEGPKEDGGSEVVTEGPREEEQGSKEDEVKDEDPKEEDQGTKVEGSVVEDEGSKVEDEGSKVEDEGPKVEDEGSKVEPEESKVEDEGSKVEPEGSKVEPEGSKVEPEGSKVEPEGSKVEPEGSKVEPEGSKEDKVEGSQALEVASEAAPPEEVKESEVKEPEVPDVKQEIHSSEAGAVQEKQEEGKVETNGTPAEGSGQVECQGTEVKDEAPPQKDDGEQVESKESAEEVKEESSAVENDSKAADGVVNGVVNGEVNGAKEVSETGEQNEPGTTTKAENETDKGETLDEAKEVSSES